MATDSFKIRAALSSDIAAISEIVALSWLDTFDGLVSPEFLASLSAEQQAERHARTFSKPETLYRVATSTGSEVIGFASGGPSRNLHVFDGADSTHFIFVQDSNGKV